MYTGINKDIQSKFECSSIESVINCRNCSIKSICGGECYVNAFMKNNDIYEPINKMCELKIELNKLSMSLINQMKNKFCLIYNQLIDFAFEVSRYEITPPEVWGTMEYLKLRNIVVSYTEVDSYLKKHDNVIQGILNYLNKYDDSISLYKIYLGNNIKFPSIAVLNKIKNNLLKFIVIINVEKDMITYKEYTFNSITDIKTTSLRYFINNLSDIIIY